MKDLRRALETFAERGTAVGSDALRERVAFALAAGGRPRRVRRRAAVPLVPLRRGVAVMVAAAVIVLLLFGGLVLLERLFGGEAEPAGPPVTTVVPPTSLPPAPTTVPEAAPPTSTAPTPTDTTVPPIATRLTMTWEAVPHTESLERGWMKAVTVGGPGLVAVGSDEFGHAAVWTTEDGIEWRRVESDAFKAERPEPEDQVVGMDRIAERYMADVASGPLGIVAVGAADGVDALRGGLSYHAAVWLSPDGELWTRVTPDTDEFADGHMHAVSYGGPGIVAVGESGDQAAVWVSEDGTSWRAVDDPGLAAGTNWARMWDVVAGGPGLIAVGEYGQPDEEKYVDPAHPGVWLSADGITWQRVPDAAIGEGRGIGMGWGRGREVAIGDSAGMLSVAVTSDGFVAIGYSRFHPGVWHSNDGVEWTPAEQYDPIEPTVSFMLYTAAAAGDRILAVGGDAEGYATFWASDDEGAGWYRIDRVPAIDRQGMMTTHNVPVLVNDLVVLESGVVAVGHTGVYFGEVDPALEGNVCGYEDPGGYEDLYAWSGSCRTDAAVWVGRWPEE